MLENMQKLLEVNAVFQFPSGRGDNNLCLCPHTRVIFLLLM